jgi:hypothetical protein
MRRAEKLLGCQIMLIEGYVVEGHVPASASKKLSTERCRTGRWPLLQ